MKKRFAFIVAIVMLISLMPSVAMAASGTITVDGTYDIGDYGIDSIITIDSLSSTDGLTVTLTNTTGNTFTNLQIDCKDATTLLSVDGVKINNSATSGACALAFTGSGNTLTLVGDSVLISGENEPGIRVEDGTALTIDSSTDGTVTATGGEYGAGIGGGYLAGGGDINISGGTVTASGGKYSVGIGGGAYRAGGDIDISGGTVTATGGFRGAGIGGGINGSGGDIDIRDGTVTAIGGQYGAGIGGGYLAGGGDINISGGTVTAIGGEYGAGIGGGQDGAGGLIDIIGGTVTATGGEYGAGIGSGLSGAGGDVDISGGTVTATGGNYSAGIGGGAYSSGGNINISGGTVTAMGGAEGAGIGGGHSGTGGIIAISEGAVTATGGLNSAGIGGGYTGAGGDIAISGGAATATGGYYGAGIGGGRWGAGGIINISAGKVTATGGEYSAGIGGGYNIAGGDVNISGADVYADGDVANGAQDIGMSASGSEGTFIISGAAAVFMKNDVCTAPTTTTHAHEVISTVDGDQVYGVSANGWTPSFGVYMRLYTLDYSANEGVGTVPDSVTQHIGTTETVGDNSGLTRTGYELGDWNTQADGIGDTYAVGDTFTFSDDVTLFAEWSVPVSSVTLSSSAETMELHDTLTLTATVLPANATYPDVTWDSSDTNVATVDQNGLVTAVALGSATITATADGQSDLCEITVEEGPGDPSYIIVIPAAVDLGSMQGNDGIVSQTFSIEMQNVVVESGYQVEVAVTSSFFMTNMDGLGSINLAYSLLNSIPMLIADGGVFATFDSNRTEDGTVQVDTADITAAGSYKGTMVFEISYVAK